MLQSNLIEHRRQDYHVQSDNCYSNSLTIDFTLDSERDRIHDCNYHFITLNAQTEMSTEFGIE